MKAKTLVPSALAAVFVWAFLGHAHDVPVHLKIAAAAVVQSANFQQYCSDNNIKDTDLFLITHNNHQENNSAEVLVCAGAMWEDDNGLDAGSARSLNHFYDPTSKMGLHIRNTLGSALPSTNWGTQSNAAFSYLFFSGVNDYAWQNARSYQSNWIVQPLQTNRNGQAALMFRSVGQVMHLLQDTSQPQHVRNEQHLDQWPFIHINTTWRSKFEDWGSQHLADTNFEINFQMAPLNWTLAGFTNLASFWDRNLYNGTDVVPLEDDVDSGPLLGLAEFCNGNFLTVTGTYGNLPGGTYELPSSVFTTLSSVQSNPAASATIVTIDGKQYAHCVVAQTNGGITVPIHSALDFLAAKFTSQTAQLNNIHADDPDVISNYHSILLPQAVAYSTGLLDYYFRGRLQVTNASISGTTCEFVAQNVSPQAFSGGKFRMFYDDASGNRTEATNLITTYSNSLASNGVISGSFTISSGADDTCTLAYFGTIGVNGSGVALDSVDANIACTSVQFLPANGDGWQFRDVDAICYVGYGAPTISLDVLLTWLNSIDITTVPWGYEIQGIWNDDYSNAVFNVFTNYEDVLGTYSCRLDCPLPYPFYEYTKVQWLAPSNGAPYAIEAYVATNGTPVAVCSGVADYTRIVNLPMPPESYGCAVQYFLVTSPPWPTNAPSCCPPTGDPFSCQ
jgi:hypothetical protein